MNKHVIHIDDNNSIVTDYEGDIKFIHSIDNNNCLHDILELENNIESLNYNLRKNIELLSNIKRNTIYGEMFNIAIYIVEILLFVLRVHTPSYSIAMYMLLTYAIAKMINVAMYNTRYGRFKNTEKAKLRIRNINFQLDILEKKLSSLKKEHNYKETYLPKGNPNTLDKEYYIQEINTNNKTKHKVKVLKLKR